MLGWLWQWLRTLFGTAAPSAQQRTSEPSLGGPRPATPQPQAPAPPPAPPATLYETHAFDCAKILEVSKSDVYPSAPDRRRPTNPQLQVIYANSGAQAVVAGAGSGKSTSLVARLLLMNKHMQIPLQQLSVFTFTRNSRFDFIDKLVLEAAHWNVTLTEEAATQRVRTFHSKVLEISRSSLPASTQIFDMLNKSVKPKPGSEEEQTFLDEQAKLADELENPFDTSRSEKQVRVLRDVYATTYGESEPFRKAVAVLLNYAFKSRLKTTRHADKDWDLRRKSADRDAAQTVHALTYWQKRGMWPVAGLQAAPRQLAVESMRFAACGYIAEADAFVVLGCPYSEREFVEVNGTRFNPYYAGCSKHTVLLRGCRDTVFFANSDEDFTVLMTLIDAVASQKSGSAPLFQLQMPGDINPSSVFEALFDIGVFAENLGIPPEGLVEKLNGQRMGPVEQAAVGGVVEFYKEFRSYCASNGMRTFNELFLALAPGSELLKEVPLAALRSMKHLLIDEFQDISPLIVQFVQGLHRELLGRTAGREHPTLLAVGDDWQSIYGWRGSAPMFFLRFPQFFEGAARKPLELTDNFRSSQRIINAAAHPVASTSPSHRLDKHCLAKNSKVAELAIPVWLIEDEDKACLAAVADIVEALMRSLAENQNVLVLSRSKVTDEKVKKACSKWSRDPRLKCMTIHKSKGLEATYVIVLGDTNYANSNPLRNAMYRAARFEQSYDQAQGDEAMRLAYVAITRAERLCIWMGAARDGGAMHTLPSAGVDVRRGDVGQLLRGLEALSA